jgi:hypothetical protein
MSGKIDTKNQIVGSVGVPEYVKLAAGSNNHTAFRESVDDAYRSYLNPEAGVKSPNNPTLEQRVQPYQGFADENMIDVHKVSAFTKSRL